MKFSISKIYSSREYLFPIFNSILCISTVGYYFLITREINRLSFRYFYDAIPTALTNLSSGTYGFTSSTAVQNFVRSRMPFMSDADLAAAKRLAEKLNTESLQTRTLLGDDLGLPHFTQLAFSLFGVQVWSLHILFGVLLAITTLLLIWCFSKVAWVQMTVMATMGSICLMTPNLFVSDQLWTWTDPRAIGVLVAAPSIFVIAFAFQSSKNWIIYFCLGVEVFVFVFLIHIRFASTWGIFAILATTISLALRDRGRRNLSFWPPVLRSSGILLLIILCSGLVAQVSQRSLDKTNSDTTPTRHLFWHTVVTAQSLGTIGQVRGQIFDDASTHELVRRTLFDQGDDNKVSLVFGADMPSGDYSQVNWQEYEAATRSVFIRDVMNQPLAIGKLIIFEKPALWIQSYSWKLGIPWGRSLQFLEQTNFPVDGVDKMKLAINSIGIGLFGLLLCALSLLSYGSRAGNSFAQALLASALLVIISISPTLVLIPLVYAMSDSIVVATTLIIVVIGWLGSKVVQFGLLKIFSSENS